MRVRSIVGLIPLFAVHVLEERLHGELPGLRERLVWFLKHRPDLAKLVSRWNEPGKGNALLLSVLRGHRMKALLRRALDESEFLSDHGVRALSRYHRDHPFVFDHNGNSFTVKYLPAESDTRVFGGNSNWRGPVWMPVNYLLIESLYEFHRYYGDEFRVEYPTGSGKTLSLSEIADELARRATTLFLKNRDGERPVMGAYPATTGAASALRIKPVGPGLSHCCCNRVRWPHRAACRLRASLGARRFRQRRRLRRGPRSPRSNLKRFPRWRAVRSNSA
jgi:hypothetical protein